MDFYHGSIVGGFIELKPFVGTGSVRHDNPLLRERFVGVMSHSNINIMQTAVRLFEFN
jgi:hypothetical protein